MPFIPATTFAPLRELAVEHTAILLAVLFAVVALLRHVSKSQPKLDLPVVDLIPGNTEKTILDSYEKYPDTPYLLQSGPPIVVLPASCVNEVKSLPENKVSMMADIKRSFTSGVTGIGVDTEELVPAIKNDLTRHIASVLDGIQDEVRFAFDKEFGTCQDWTRLTLYPTITNIVALLSSRVFVGRPLSRDEEWLKATITYTFDCIKARDACAKYPTFLRPIVGPYLPEVRHLKHARAKGAKMLQPMLGDILSRQEKGQEKADLLDYEDEQGTMFSWMLKHATGHRRTAKVLANNQMGLSFAAIHTSTMSLCQALFDLISKPQYIKPLQEELEQVIQEDGEDVDTDGFFKLKKTSFTKLKKLDSFLKESQRLNPPELIAMTRVTTAPLTLSTGHTLPKNTRICFPAFAIHTSQSTPTFSANENPSDSYTPPTQFDGFRFSKLRSMPGKENKHQFVTTSPESLSFGHGTHACPGRFFASNEIKVVLVELLRNWEMRLVGDVEGKGGERPKNMMSGGFGVAPNMMAQIELRRSQRG